MGRDIIVLRLVDGTAAGGGLGAFFFSDFLSLVLVNWRYTKIYIHGEER